VSASIANLDLRYDRTNGLSIKTGWSKPASAPAVAAAPAADTNAAQWRAELTAMQQQLRKEMRLQAQTVAASSAPVPSAASATSDDDVRRLVRVMLDESEQKQKKDLALQLVQLQQDLYAQRQADFSKLYQTIGIVQSTTNQQLAKQASAISLVTGRR